MQYDEKNEESRFSRIVRLTIGGSVFRIPVCLQTTDLFLIRKGLFRSSPTSRYATAYETDSSLNRRIARQLLRSFIEKCISMTMGTLSSKFSIKFTTN